MLRGVEAEVFVIPVPRFLPGRSQFPGHSAELNKEGYRRMPLFATMLS